MSKDKPETFSGMNGQQFADIVIESLYKRFCRETKRSGGILVGASIKEWHLYLGKQLAVHRNYAEWEDIFKEIG